MVSLSDLPAPALANICVKRPQISTRPLWPYEYYPPGTSRTSRIRTGVDADRIYNATVEQRKHIIQQLEEAEKNARDALFALEMVEMELARETSAMKTTLSHLSETLPQNEFEKMCDFAFGESKRDWEQVWKHEWVDDGTERDKFTPHPRSSSRKSRFNPPVAPLAPHILSSPLPPSSPPSPTSPLNSQNRLSRRASPIRTNGIPVDEYQRSARLRSPPPSDGFRVPRGFVDNFGSTRYRPTVPEPASGPSQPSEYGRRLKRDTRRVVHRQNIPVLVDLAEGIEAHRREIREVMQLQAQRILPVEAQVSMLRIVQKPTTTDGMRDQPVTWFRVFKDREVPQNDLTNPFSQDDHVPPTYPEAGPCPDQDEREPGPESETNPHV